MLFFTVHTISAKTFLASCPFNKKMCLPSANLAQFLYTIDAKNIFAVWVPIQLKKYTTFYYMTLSSFM